MTLRSLQRSEGDLYDSIKYTCISFKGIAMKPSQKSNFYSSSI